MSKLKRARPANVFGRPVELKLKLLAKLKGASYAQAKNESQREREKAR